MMFFIVAFAFVLLILSSYQITLEKSDWKYSLVSLVRGFLWRYFACWSVCGLLIYLVVGGILTYTLFYSPDVDAFLGALLAAVMLYLICWPFTMIFHWFMYKIKQQKTYTKMDWLYTFMAVGFFLYPFVVDLCRGDFEGMLVGNLTELSKGSFLPLYLRPDGISSLLRLFLVGVAVLVYFKPLAVLSGVSLAVFLFWVTDKKVQKVMASGSRAVEKMKKGAKTGKVVIDPDSKLGKGIIQFSAKMLGCTQERLDRLTPAQRKNLKMFFKYAEKQRKKG